jgi:signal transduction histidine kinase
VQARKVEVMLSADERSIHISISDDGIGFDKD